MDYNNILVYFIVLLRLLTRERGVLMLKIIAEETVYSGKNNPVHSSCAFGQICVLPDGRWLCGFRAAPTKNRTEGQKALMTVSQDQGRSWSPPVEPFQAPAVDGKLGAFRSIAFTSLSGARVMATLFWVDVSNPHLPFFNEDTWGLLDSKIFHAFSEDYGEHWSEPQLMQAKPFDFPIALTGPTLRLANGDLACQFELNKHYYDESPWRHSSVMMFSHDEGKTWPDHSIITSHPTLYYWDQRPAVMNNGEILDLFWTYDNKAGVYRNIHARSSRDNGKSWGEIWDTGVPGQPAPPQQFADGSIAMVYVDRTRSPEIRVRTSLDGGQSWPNGSDMLLYKSDSARPPCSRRNMEEAWAEMANFSLGLPATCMTGDNKLLAIFYAGPHKDKTDIHWRLLEQES
jgi:hypothetical protein